MNTIRLLDWGLYAGHGYGLKGPLLTYRLRWPDQASWSMKKAIAHLVQQQPLSNELETKLSGQALNPQGFIQLFHVLEIALANPFAQQAQLLKVKRNASQTSDYWIAQASQEVNGTIALLQWLIQHIHQAHQVNNTAVVSTDSTQLLRAAKSFGVSINQSINTARIIKAAMELDIPVKQLPGKMLMVGTGKYAQLLDSTITERTSSIGVNIARRKSLTSQYLRMHGLPTPLQKVIDNSSIDAAIAAANSIGYPVVVKPSDMDGGVGVYAGLTDESQLRECFPLAAEKSKNLLIEQHIQGEDYRITVIDGEVVKAIGRRPGGVIGDGIHTVQEIVATDAAYIHKNHPGRKTVEIDEEALSVLAAAGRSIEDVLPIGEFQPLRRRANMSTGGISRNVLNVIHPDNIRLAIQAAQALKLDIAGIDLITPDIERSWMDVDAAICEVNAQPQISTEFAENVYVNFLQRRLSGRGRMRTVLMVSFDSDASAQPDLECVEKELIRQSETVICIKESGTWLSGTRISPIKKNIFQAALQAELNPDATAVLACLSVQFVLEFGIPWQQIDHTCLLNIQGHNTQHQSKLKTLQRLLRGHTTSPISMYIKNASQSPPFEFGEKFETILTLNAGWPQPLGQIADTKTGMSQPL